VLSQKVLLRKNIDIVAAYYKGSADDYYAKDGSAAQWQGKGAEYLNLSGEVESRRFRELLAGKIAPQANVERRTTRKDSYQRIGIDLTFSAPKSVSLQALVARDARVIAAHDRAVARAIEAAEALADTRMRIGRKSRVVATGNLIVAKFRHETSREKDPQLHTHAVVLNLTRRSDGQWRALKNDRLVKATRYLGAVYRAELAAELQVLGYQIRHERDGLFELAHISRTQIEGFSRRAGAVEAQLRAQGLDRETATTRQKQREVLMSRPRKTAERAEVLYRDWQARARELGIDFGAREWAGPGGGRDRREVQPDYAAATKAAARAAVDYAVRHLTERTAIVRGPELADVAARQAVGAAGPADIQAEIARRVADGRLIREAPRYRLAEAWGNEPGQSRQAWVAELMEKYGLDRTAAKLRVKTGIQSDGLVVTEARYTTPAALSRERAIIEMEREGRGKVVPVLSREQVAMRLAEVDLNSGQRRAAELILTTANRVVGIQGYAGTGKSFALRAVREALEAEGYQVQTLASYGAQVKALRELGSEGQTIAAFLRRQNKGIGPQSVLIIDEAGVIPARLMDRVLREAEKAGSRVVLVGDIMQTKAIEAGRPFHQLQQAGMETATLDQIQRQREPELKAAVELAAQRQGAAALARIPAVRAIGDDGERHAAIAADYLALNPASRDRTLIVSGTNEARRDINDRIREGLGLVGTGQEYDTLTRRDTTQEERRHAKHYRVGDVIQPERDYAGVGLRRGDLYRVLDTGPGNQLTVQDEDGAVTSFSPWTVRRLSVYEPRRAELAPGDIVRVTRNDAALDLANGDRFRVANVSRESIVLEGGGRTVELPADRALHLDHAYASTVHGAQGLTADRVLIDAHSRSRLTADDWFYVAISRPKVEARIYTDDAGRLPEAVARLAEKPAALDLERARAPTPPVRGRERERSGPELGL
jgi:conjugative relaxase-like TrwC/TraI family protein